MSAFSVVRIKTRSPPVSPIRRYSFIPSVVLVGREHAIRRQPIRHRKDSLISYKHVVRGGLLIYEDCSGPNLGVSRESTADQKG